MKSSHEVASVEELCRLLRHSKLLSPEEIESLAKRWRGEAGDAGAAPAFASWLVAEGAVTDYQAGRLLRGRDSNFFLAGYKLLDQLNRGKHTVVYKAERDGRLAALKVLPSAQTSDARTLARFLREVKRGRELNHPNVVRVLDAGEDRGAHYLALEYLEGETLQKVLRHRTLLPMAEAIDLGLQAMSALTYLHERGLAHRNFTPANLMLVPATGESKTLLQVLDFGTSRAADAEDYLEPASSGRVQEALRGSAAYLAPEVVRDPASADIRADLYSLGCVLYHALVGQTPFPDPSPEVQAARHAAESPRLLCEVNPELPEELAHVVARLMARNPAQRFASPAEAMEALLALSSKLAAPAVSIPPVPVPPASWLADHVPPPPLPSRSEPPAEGKQEPSFPAEVQPPEIPAFDLGPSISSAPVVAPVSRRSQRSGRRLDRRDWLLLLTGAGVLLLVQSLAWLAAWLISASR